MKKLGTAFEKKVNFKQYKHFKKSLPGIYLISISMHCFYLVIKQSFMQAKKVSIIQITWLFSSLKLFVTQKETGYWFKLTFWM